MNTLSGFLEPLQNRLHNFQIVPLLFGSVVDHCCAFFSLCDAVIVFVVVEWQEGGDAVVNIQL